MNLGKICETNFQESRLPKTKQTKQIIQTETEYDCNILKGFLFTWNVQLRHILYRDY